MKIIFTLFFSILTFYVGANAPHRVVAVVDKQAITDKEFDERVRLALINAPSLTDTRLRMLKHQILQQIIDERLQLQEAKRFDIGVSDKEIDAHISSIEEQQKMNPGDLLKLLSSKGVSADTFRNHVRAGIAWARFSFMLKDYAKTSKREVQSYLKSKRNKARYLLGEIIIPIDDPMDGAQGAEAQANRAFKDIESGKPFVLVAQNVSASPSAAIGGDIDWVDEDMLEPELRDILPYMPVGSLSKPIETKDSYRIIALRAKQNPGGETQSVSMRQADILFPLLMSEKDKAAYVEKLARASQKIQGCADFDKWVDSLSGATLQMHNDVSLSQLSGGLDKLIDDLEIGQISSPVSMGPEGVAFFMVCERKDIDTEKKKEELEASVEESLQERHLQSLLKRRMQDMRRQAYIQIR